GSTGGAAGGKSGKAHRRKTGLLSGDRADGTGDRPDSRSGGAAAGGSDCAAKNGARRGDIDRYDAFSLDRASGGRPATGSGRRSGFGLPCKRRGSGAVVGRNGTGRWTESRSEGVPEAHDPD